MEQQYLTNNERIEVTILRNLIFNEEDGRWYECNIEESKSCDGL